MVWDAETTPIKPNVQKKRYSLIHINRTVRMIGFFSGMQGFVCYVKKFDAEFGQTRKWLSWKRCFMKLVSTNNTLDVLKSTRWTYIIMECTIITLMCEMPISIPILHEFLILKWRLSLVWFLFHLFKLCIWSLFVLCLEPLFR